MKKFLPIFFIFFFVSLFFVKSRAFADGTPPDPGTQLQQGPTVPDNSWVLDPEVTFVGQNAARSGNLLNFTLANYSWACVNENPNGNGQCDNSNNPLEQVWLTTVTYIVVPLLFVVILATAIVIIVTRGRSLTIMRFLPRFIAVILLIFFSYALIQFFYQFVDIIQGFFLRSSVTASCPPTCISDKDLLSVSWHYVGFQGLRLTGDANTESAFISLLLTKLTALTYFVMVGILFLRRIILWLFIIVSPIFPLLLLFYPIRNTAKIWIGEFFRWLLYAPLFALFLNGLVALWRSGIPLIFNQVSTTDASQIVYPTAVNILLGGPKEFVTMTNSVNLTETFALYVVSLLMLWGVIILPWILLQIFLDYASNSGVGDSAVMKSMVNMINRQPPSPSGHPTSGSSISLPFSKRFNMPVPPSAPTGAAKEIPVGISASNLAHSMYMPSAQVKAQILNLSNVSIPSLRDIAKYDTALLGQSSSNQQEISAIRQNLQKIANPASSSSSAERGRYAAIHEKLTQESSSGNTLATSILNAANIASKRSSQVTSGQLKNILSNIANPSSIGQSASVVNRDKLAKMNQSLVKAKQEGSTLAAEILSVTAKTPDADIEKLQERIREAKEKGEPIGTQIAEITQKKDTLPVVNHVQTVSKEDYEAVKQMWKENYKNLEVPEGMAGTRDEWVKDDIAKIDDIVALLGSRDEEQIAQGMEEVSSILPFLLVGGFSQTEIVAYLKAKQEAAKEVVAELAQEEEDKVSVSVKKTATATQTMSVSIPEDSGDDTTELNNLGASNFVPQVSNAILKMTNLELPKLTDIVQYEVRHLTKDKTESERIEKIHQVLEEIANPTSITSAQEKEQYEQLQVRLADESKKGNITAGVVLSAVSQLSRTSGKIDATLTEIKTVLQQITNPNSLESADDRDYYTRLHQYLEKESKEKDNLLAKKILSVNEATGTSDIQDIKDQLIQAAQKGEPIAQSVMEPVMQPVKLPESNRLQQVTPEEYKQTKQLWEKAYRQYFVPPGFAEDLKGRTEWINKDITDIQDSINLLESDDAEKKNNGLKKVSSILPFLLLGGFSFNEMITYLKTKLEAAKSALVSVNEEEDKSVEVSVKKNEQLQSKTMSEEVKDEKKSN